MTRFNEVESSFFSCRQLSWGGNMEMVSFTSICSLTSLLHPVPSAVPELLHTNKPTAAGSPEATGWTTEEGTEV